MIEHDPERLKRYWNARAYFSITNNTAEEMLAEIAMRHRDTVLGRTQKPLEPVMKLGTALDSLLLFGMRRAWKDGVQACWVCE